MYQPRHIKRTKNPREDANILSILSFFYTVKIFQIGNRSEIQDDDVFEILPDYKSQLLGDKLEKEWNKELLKKRKLLIRAIFTVFGKKYFLFGLFSCIFKVTYMIIKPIAIGRLVSYFAPGQTRMTKETAYFYAIALIIAKFFFEFARHWYYMGIEQIGIQVRCALCSMFYRKTLKVNELSSDDTSAGKIMTLMTKDMEVIEQTIFFGHDIWVSLIEAVVMSYMVYKNIGLISTMAGVGFLVAVMPIQYWVGVITASTRYKASARTDERLRLMQEIFSTIKLIKIYTWDRFFTKQGIKARKREMNKLRSIYYLKSVVLSIGFISTRLSFYICMMVYMYLGNNITAEKAFVVISCYNLLKYILGMSIPINITRISESTSSIRRMTMLLLASEIKKENIITDDDVKLKTKIVIQGASVETCNGKTILKNVNIDLSSGLIGVTGAVGSGKSTLLKLVLEDVATCCGSVDVAGTISYASQEPWIFPGSIRQNILFGQEFDEKRYREVIRLCALERDIQNWQHEDHFIVNDRGLNISKGQQARINLARAIYKNSDIYLIDDSLSALDAKVSRHVFEHCIKKFLADKLCIMVTHNTNILKETENMFYMKAGSIAHRGTFSELLEAGVDFGDSVDNVQPDCAEELKEVLIKEAMQEDTENEKSDEDTKLLTPVQPEITSIYKEHHKDGKVDFDIYKLYFYSAGGFKFVPLVLIIFVLGQGFTSYFDYFVSKWVDLEQNRTDYALQNLTHTPEYERVEEVYAYTKIMYSVIIVCATIFTAAMSFSFYALSTRASKIIHDMSFKKIMGASMAFFDQNLSGTVLNRFSKDFTLIDELLPYTFFDCMKILFIMIGIGINITSVKLLFIIPTVLFGGVLYIVKCYYIKTGRGLQRLDGITRAPVVGHLNASLNGLTTIRSSGNEAILSYQFDRHLDLNTSAYYMFATSCRAFQFFMDMLCGVYIAIIILTFLVFESDTLAGQVGLAVTQAFSLTGMMQWGIRQWSQMENRMTSVERVMEYTSVEQEDHSGVSPPDWPTKGKLEYRNVSMCYSNSEEPVLKNVNFVVQPQEKVGVIGRTGAGKSSILSALFRLYKIEGAVLIDGLNLTGIQIDYVRSKISIIPQDPTLFTGTLRSNLDPYNEHKDEQLWKILKKVELTNTVTDLDCPVLENGANFSIGQRQLICLARAILRNNKILVLDEATANVDPHTDTLIQNIIASVFVDCTILTIAHRLNTVMKCDKVMVVDQGTVVEFDTPEKLLENTDGIFYNLAKTSGNLTKSDNPDKLQ